VGVCVNFESIIKKNRRNFIGGHTTTTTKNEKRIYKFLSRNKNPKIKKKLQITQKQHHLDLDLES
jgi:hypothetical protein